MPQSDTESPKDAGPLLLGEQQADLGKPGTVLPEGIISDFTPCNPEFLELLKSHFNEPLIVHTQIERLIGYAEDELDCYLICMAAGGAVSWNTAVGGYTFLDRLKGQGHVISVTGEHWDDLWRLDSMLGYNGCPKADKFLMLKDTRPQP